MADLVYKDLSYKLVGLAFEVNCALGSGLKEKTYADAYEELLKEEKIKYQREFYFPLKIRGKIVSQKYFDFLIEDKIILEFKIGGDKFIDAYRQIFEYLKTSDLKLGIIIRFTRDGVKIKRIVNIY